MMPLVLLVGFLGAGKTRFLTQLIPALRARQLRSRVILNDFENASIDAARLEQLTALVTPLNGECVCCGSLTELMDMLQAVRGEPGDVMLIEANGATVADELIGYLTMDRQLAHFTLPLQVTVIDAARWQKRWWHNSLEADQTRTATHVMLNWTHKLSPKRLEAVQASVREVNARAMLTDAEALAETLATIEQSARGQSRRSASLPVLAEPSHQHSHSHPFASASMALPDLVDRSAFMQFARELPVQVVRAKGFVRFVDHAETMFVWNRVGGRKGVQLDASVAHASAQPTALFIGVDLPLDLLSAQVQSLAPNSATEPASRSPKGHNSPASVGRII